MALIDISGMDKAALLAGLYNGAKAVGMGVHHYEPRDMTRDEAQSLLDAGKVEYDYHKGRLMKVEFKGNQLDAWGYDNQYGNGATQRVIDAVASAAAADRPIVAMRPIKLKTPGM